MEAMLPIIFGILESDRDSPRKQRHTARRIYDRLVAEHDFHGCYESVKEAVREWKQGNKEVFLPLSHPPSEAQVDFGFAEMDVAGQRVKAALFVMTLPFSDAVCMQAFPRECTESFQEGHKRAFQFLGAVAHRISYDNSRISISKIVGSRERECTREFLRLQSHYLFRSHFCLVRRAQEKGHVENLLGYARRNFLVPVPDVSSFAEINATLERRCREDLERGTRGKPGSKGERLAEERQAMMDLPTEEFEARRVACSCANTMSLVRFDSNSYSVPVAYAHQPITIAATVDTVRLSIRGRTLAVHPRHWGRSRDVFDPVHYLPLLERKPGGFDFARPTKSWELPDCFVSLRRQMEREPDGTRQFIRTLRLLERASMPELSQAVQRALEIGVHDVDSIIVILDGQREQTAPAFSLDCRVHLQTVEVSETSVSAYQSLLTEESH
jgi:transposase